jgi:ABC-2 type transport system ATP-binding protein
MEEAERLCHRIGVMDEGRLVAEGTRQELVEGIGAPDTVTVVVAQGAETLAGVYANLPGVERTEVVGAGVELVATRGRTLLRALLDGAEKAGVVVDGIEVNQPDLETVFLSLTGKALRD